MARRTFQWKKSTLAFAAAVTLCLLAAGTYAWTAARQADRAAEAETPPGVNLHDDFAQGPEKDVYAENSGGEAMLTRVRLTELLIRDGETLPRGAADDAAGSGWHRHAGGSGNPAECGFEAHRYYTWTLGGHKLYMPAAPSALARGDYADKNTFTAPRDVGDSLRVVDYAPLLREAFSQRSDTTALDWLEGWLAGDGANAQNLQTAIAGLPGTLTVESVLQYPGQPEDEQTRRLNEVRLTAIPGGVTSMEAWEAGDKALGGFWVMDADGWCYWAGRLSAGQATGQLLQSCAYTADGPANLTYKIRAELDAVTTDPEDINSYLTRNHALGDITEGGILLTLLSSGSYTYGADSEFYLPKGDNTYVRVLKNDGSYANYILGRRVCAGADETVGSADDLKPGDGAAVREDGSLYHIDNADGHWTPDGSWDGPYQITEIVSGENGAAYLALDDGAGNVSYCCSVESITPGDVLYQFPATLGLGPYRLVWPGEDGKLGTADDLYHEDFAAVKQADGSVQFYRRLSQKVYIRVAHLGDAAPALYLSEDGLWYVDAEGNYINEADLTPMAGMEGKTYTGKAAPLYYAAGRQYAALEPTTYYVGAETGAGGAVTYNFPFLLGTEFKFTQGSAYLFPADGGYAASAMDLYELTPAGVVRGQDGAFYLRTEVSSRAPRDRWYIGPGADGVLGTADDVRLKAGKDLLIGTADDWDGAFTEPFLAEQGKTPENLLPGETFTTDAAFTTDGKPATWIVLDVDEFGNRLIMSQNHIDPFKSYTFGADNTYQGSVLQAKLKTLTETQIPVLRPYLLDAATPVESGGWDAAMPTQKAALSYALTTKNDPTVFALSQSEYTVYDVANKTPNNATNSWFWTRTPASAGMAAVFFKTGLTTNDYREKPVSAGNSLFPAAWVRFSDADHFPEPPSSSDFTFTESFLTGKTTGDLNPGGTFTADGYDWVVLEADGYGNRLIATTTTSGRAVFTPSGTNTVYVGSNLHTAFQTFTDETSRTDADTMGHGLVNLKPLIQSPNLPQSGLSAVGGDYGACAFPLSAAEYTRYKTILDASWADTFGYGLRSIVASSGEVEVVNYPTTANPEYHLGPVPLTHAPSCRPALWARFSDADAAPREILPYDFTGLPGDRLYADGYDWVVLDSDEAGNRMLLSKQQIAEMGARYNDKKSIIPYSDARNLWPARAAAFTAKLESLQPCLRAAELPEEAEYSYRASWSAVSKADGSLSSCAGSAAGAAAFPISAKEFTTYLYDVPGMVRYRESTPGYNAWGLRSVNDLGTASDAGPASTFYAGLPDAIWDAYNSTVYPPKMALWVNFG